MRLKMKFAFAVAAAVLAGVAVSVHAQSAPTNITAIVGSSAQYLELGQASSLTSATGTVCVFDSGGTNFTVTDNRGTAGEGFPYTDSGETWVEWNSGTGTSTIPNGTWNITLFVNVDSVVGNRAMFGGAHVTNPYTGSGSIASGPALVGIATCSLPPAVFNAINSANAGAGALVNVAATDIRPEDAKFAVNRALTACGTPIQDTALVNVGGTPTATSFYTQYLGIGDQNTTLDPSGRVGNKIQEGQLSTKKFNVLQFNIAGNDPFTGNPVPAYTTVELGAVPVLVIVNPSNTAGFGSLQLSNIDRATLSGYLDGTYGSTSDAFLNASTNLAAPPSGSNVFLREYMSGTYNTMEYSIPNSVENKSSQEVGTAAYLAANNVNGFAEFPPYNCNGNVFALSTNANSGSLANPLYEAYSRNSGETSIRGREIGTGDEIKAVLATAGLGTCNTTSNPACAVTQPNVPGKDSLGYGFWSVANYNNARAGTAKYLSVDGIDPIQQVWTDGLVPNAVYDNLGSVSFDNIRNGTYPILSFLRLAAVNGNPATTVQALVASAGRFLSPTQNDFVAVGQLPIVRSHFAPPGVAFAYAGGTCTPNSVGANGCFWAAANGTGSNQQAGGDVGGLALTLQSELDYITDTGNQNGNTGWRE